MPQLLQLSSPVVGAAARLHPDQAWLRLGEKFRHLVAFALPPLHRVAVGIAPVDLDYALAKSAPIVVTFITGAPFGTWLS